MLHSLQRAKVLHAGACEGECKLPAVLLLPTAESVKPRGVVDLSKVQDVRDGRAVTGKANTVQLKTASGGSVCYVCESGAYLRRLRIRQDTATAAAGAALGGCYRGMMSSAVTDCNST